MADNDASNPAEEVAAVTETEDTGASAAAATEEEGGENGAENDEAEGTSDSEQDEEIELNFGGNKLRVPKTAIPEEVAAKISEFSRDLESGYTKKFQDLAEQRKSVEATREAVERMQSLSDEVLNEYARGLTIRDQLTKLEQVNLMALWQSNPDQARRISDNISHLRAEYDKVVRNVDAAEGKLAKERTSQDEARLAEGRQEVERRIPGFIEKHADKVVDYAVKAGVPKEHAGNWAANPIFTEMAFKAMQWDEAQARAKQAAKPKPPQAQPVAPTRSTGGRPKLDLVRDADKMSADEWLKRRKAQLRA